MKTDIILCGVGGQGILSIATIIGEAALNENLNIKQAEVHGMSQRGGDVQSNLRISSQPIHSDLIAQGQADVIISMEPMEALRYLPYLKKTDGSSPLARLSSTSPIIPTWLSSTPTWRKSTTSSHLTSNKNVVIFL